LRVDAHVYRLSDCVQALQAERKEKVIGQSIWLVDHIQEIFKTLLTGRNAAGTGKVLPKVDYNTVVVLNSI
jgi:hypothetical protein